MRLSKEILPAIASEYKNGMTHQELGDKYGVDAETIRRHLRNHGVPMRPRGQPHGKFLPNGGKTIDKHGYVLVKVPHGSHPYANNAGYVREHRLVMEKHLGRFLERHEVVHHLNQKKDDNRIENLSLYSSHAKHFSEEMKGNNFGAKNKIFHYGRKNRSDDEILDCIRTLASCLDRPLMRVDFCPPGMPSYTVVNKRFGHWSKAVELALESSLE